MVQVSETSKSLNSDYYRWHCPRVIDRLGCAGQAKSSEPTHRGQASCPIARIPLLATKVAVHWPPGGRKLPLRPASTKPQDGADMLLPATSPGIQMFYFSFSERIRQGSSLLLGGRAVSRVYSGTTGVRGCPPGHPLLTSEICLRVPLMRDSGAPPWLCLTARSHHEAA